jgi:hypothetical protein
VWIVTLVLLTATLVLLVGGDGLTASGIVAGLGFAAFVVVYATVGALVSAHRPGHAVGRLMAGAAAAWVAGAMAVVYASATSPATPGVAAVVSPLISVTFNLGVALGGPILLLRFPDGRLPSRRWRPVVALTGAAVALIAIGETFTPAPLDEQGTPNPLGIAGAGPALEVVSRLGDLAFAVAIALALASLIIRYRSADEVGRRQLKWLAYAALLTAVASLAATAVAVALPPGALTDDVVNSLVAVTLSALPVAIGIAILRHRLYDIDRVVSRTVSYALLTGLLGLVYAGGVVALGTLRASSDLAVAGSTLAVAALFGPARRRIQSAVDRRFNRARYDAARTVESFAARLRDKVDLDELSAELLGAVRTAVEPDRASLWLRPAGPRR